MKLLSCTAFFLPLLCWGQEPGIQAPPVDEAATEAEQWTNELRKLFPDCALHCRYCAILATGEASPDLDKGDCQCLSLGGCRFDTGRKDPYSNAVANGIVWYGVWEDAITEMERTGKPVIVHFGAPRCGSDDGPLGTIRVSGAW